MCSHSRVDRRANLLMSVGCALLGVGLLAIQSTDPVIHPAGRALILASVVVNLISVVRRRAGRGAAPGA